MTKHKVEIYWSQPDNAFIAEAPELPGCCADGPTRQQAVSNLEIIIDEWIETATQLDRTVPGGFTIPSPPRSTPASSPSEPAPGPMS